MNRYQLFKMHESFSPLQSAFFLQKNRFLLMSIESSNIFYVISCTTGPPEFRFYNSSVNSVEHEF